MTNPIEHNWSPQVPRWLRAHTTGTDTKANSPGKPGLLCLVDSGCVEQRQALHGRLRTHTSQTWQPLPGPVALSRCTSPTSFATALPRSGSAPASSSDFTICGTRAPQSCSPIGWTSRRCNPGSAIRPRRSMARSQSPEAGRSVYFCVLLIRCLNRLSHWPCLWWSPQSTEEGEQIGLLARTQLFVVMQDVLGVAAVTLNRSAQVRG